MEELELVLIMATAIPTEPTVNLGGHSAAQEVAGAIGTATGISIGGPMQSAGIAAIGGPVVAGVLAATAIGGAVYGTGKLVYTFLI